VLDLQPWSTLSELRRKLLLKTARTMLECGVTAKRYISAQFWWFNRYGRNKRGIVLLPQPWQLFGNAAKERLKRYSASLEEDRNRSVEVRQSEANQTDFTRETRKLREMATLLDVDKKDVLALAPTEFSREFLKKHGAWTEETRQQWVQEAD